MLAGEEGEGNPAEVFHASVCITGLEGSGGEICVFYVRQREDGGGVWVMMRRTGANREMG